MPRGGDDAIVGVLRQPEGSFTALRQRLREVAQTRVRFGYRRLRVLLQREGWTVGKERFYRVYTEEGLALQAAVAARDRGASRATTSGGRSQ